MLQSYSGILRLFPNTANLGPAGFRNLCAWSFSKGGVAGVADPWHPTVTALPGGQPVAAYAAEAGVVSRIETTARTVYRVSRA